MKNMKKQLACSVLCLALLLIMMLSTTVAWFTDTAAANNTMVVGKISITQTVVDTQYTVMPTVEIPRLITVKNDGNQPAYVRTLIAFEDTAIAGDSKSMLDYMILGDDNITFPVDEDGNKIQFSDNGTTYTVGYYLHGELAANVSYTCLNTIELDATAPSAWQEASVDGQYTILVLSQAVQSVGFEDGAAAALDNTNVFGSVADNAETWFKAILNAQVNP